MYILLNIIIAVPELTKIFDHKYIFIRVIILIKHKIFYFFFPSVIFVAMFVGGDLIISS